MHSPAEALVDVCSFLFYKDICSLQLVSRILASVISSNIDRLPLMTRYRLEVYQDGFGGCFLDLVDVETGRIAYSLYGGGSEMSKVRKKALARYRPIFRTCFRKVLEIIEHFMCWISDV